jgi:hypothetical protein
MSLLEKRQILYQNLAIVAKTKVLKIFSLSRQTGGKVR